MARFDLLTKHCLELASDLRSVDAGAIFRLARALPGFFRKRVNIDQPRANIQMLLGSREERFLQLVRTKIYGNAASPYRKLLAIADYDFHDLDKLVRRARR